MKKKTKAFIATLLIAAAIVLASMFICLFMIRDASSLGKQIVVSVTCIDTCYPIEGLPVKLTLNGALVYPVAKTDANGEVLFSGLIDGTYEIHYFWAGQSYTDSVTIDCN